MRLQTKLDFHLLHPCLNWEKVFHAVIKRDIKNMLPHPAARAVQAKKSVGNCFLFGFYTTGRLAFSSADMRVGSSKRTLHFNHLSTYGYSCRDGGEIFRVNSIIKREKGIPRRETVGETKRRRKSCNMVTLALDSIKWGERSAVTKMNKDGNMVCGTFSTFKTDILSSKLQKKV